MLWKMRKLSKGRECKLLDHKSLKIFSFLDENIRMFWIEFAFIFKRNYYQTEELCASLCLR